MTDNHNNNNINNNNNDNKNDTNQTLPRLSRSILVQLKNKGKVMTPSYDVSTVGAGILHVGVGNFHRSHFALYMNDLFNDPTLGPQHHRDWGIVGAGMLSFDETKREQLSQQDWLSTIVERDGTSINPIIVSSMIDFIPVDYEYERHEELQSMLSLTDQIKIVSLTVTEGGYFLEANGKFNVDHPLVQHDVIHPDQPKTIFGILVKALKYRRDHSLKPFTILSCDNIPHNGNVVRSLIVGIARAQQQQQEQQEQQEQDKQKDDDDDKNHSSSSSLVEWIETNVTFPNSMVDRITPGTTPAMRQYIETEYEYIDAAPIFCEPYRQWILEDQFCSGRPAWEQLNHRHDDENGEEYNKTENNRPNISFVPDVAPYECMKIRILNGGHASLCYPAALLNVKYVHDATNHSIIGPFLNALEINEIIPTVPRVPDYDDDTTNNNINLLTYWKLIQSRFANPTIMDTIERICYDGANRQPKFIVPVVSDLLLSSFNEKISSSSKEDNDNDNDDNDTKEKEIDKVYGLALVSALWCRYCEGYTESGSIIPSNDPQWDRLQSLAQRIQKENLPPTMWLTELCDVYGTIVGESIIFGTAFTRAWNIIHQDGVQAALESYIQTHTHTQTHNK